MKKWLVMLLCLLCLPTLADAAVPDELLHDAVMTLTWEDDRGECWVEGHVVLGEENKGDTTEVYMHVHYLNYGFRDGVFTDTGGGSIHPATFVFEHTKDGYRLQKIIEPEDGEYYNRSIRAMMPQHCIDKMGSETRAEMERQMVEQAQSYLDAIGRTEKIQDWRERDLPMDDMLVQASNLVIDLKGPYPLWLTNEERVEDGVRYVYYTRWDPDEHSPSDYTYLTADGRLVPVQGKTGYQSLTKIRKEDGKQIELITIRADLNALTIIMIDDYGSISYVFEYDGQTYHQPEIRRTGECRISYPVFEGRIAQLPEAMTEQETTTVVREENGKRTLVITSRHPNGNVITTECPNAVRMEGPLPKVEVSGASYISLAYENYRDIFLMYPDGIWRFAQSQGYNMENDYVNYVVLEDESGLKGAVQLTQVMYVGDGQAYYPLPTLLMEESFSFEAASFDVSRLPKRSGAVTKERAQRYVDEYLPEGLTAISGSMGTKGIGILAEDESGQRLLYMLREDGPGKFIATKGNVVPSEAAWDDGHGWTALNLELYGPETAYCQIGLRTDGRTWGITYIGGVDWFEVEEYGLRKDEERYLGDHPWRSLQTADLTNLPMTFDDAVAQLDTGKIAVVNNPDPADRLHLRIKPNRDAKSQGKYYNGTIVQVERIQGDWAEVRVADVGGWMMTKYLAFGDDVNRVESAFPVLDIREEVIENGVEVCNYPDELVIHIFWHMPGRCRIIGIVDDEWYHVVFEEDSLQGYVRQNSFWEGNG